MDRIRNSLVAKDPGVGQRLLPTKVHRIERIPANESITTKWQSLLATSHLGSQYDWLARLAEAHDVTLELSIHRDDTAHAFLHGVVERTTDGSYRLKVGADGDLDIFGRFSFPLFEHTKIDMQQHAAASSFSHVMEMTWFCYRPMLDGKPCGYCNPCKYTRDEGLGRRVPAHTPMRRLQYRALTAGWLASRRLRRSR